MFLKHYVNEWFRRKTTDENRIVQIYQDHCERNIIACKLKNGVLSM